MSALAKDPEHRYQSADDLRADLLRFRRGRPLAAAPVTAIVTEVPTAASQATPAAALAAYAATVATPRVSTTAAAESTAPVYTRRKRQPALVTFTLLTLLVLVLVVGGILFAATKLGSSEADGRPCPTSSARTAHRDRQELAREAHLGWKQVTATSDRPVDTGRSRRIPKPGTSVKKNRTVTLTVSTGVGTRAQSRRRLAGRPSPTRRPSSPTPASRCKVNAAVEHLGRSRIA